MVVATSTSGNSSCAGVNAPNTAGENPASYISERRYGIRALAASPRSRTQRVAGGRVAPDEDVDV
eukprot:30957-Pelagococcus_subviridis.AAC.4